MGQRHAKHNAVEDRFDVCQFWICVYFRAGSFGAVAKTPAAFLASSALLHSLLLHSFIAARSDGYLLACYCASHRPGLIRPQIGIPTWYPLLVRTSHGHPLRRRRHRHRHCRLILPLLRPTPCPHPDRRGDYPSRPHVHGDACLGRQSPRPAGTAPSGPRTLVLPRRAARPHEADGRHPRHLGI